VTVDGYGNASAGDATQYEDYVDQGALASLIALARSNFDPVASQRLQSYVDPAELRRLQASARNEYQFDPESYQDDPAARASAFARAKEQIGLIGRASMNSLRNQFAARNLLGSGGEAVARGGVLAGAGSDLSNFATTQALDEAAERSAVSARNAAGRQAMEARLSGLTPTFIAGATKQRYVPGDPTDVQNSINAYIQSLMPTLIAQSKRRRRLAE
jgi:hypothetical protein